MSDSLPENTDELKQAADTTRRTMFSRVRLVSLMTIASRVLGLFRDIGMAMCFGNDVILDAFTIAFRIPNTARAIFGEGALSTAFIPKYVALLQEQGKPAANQFALQVFWSLAWLLGSVTILGEVILGLVLWCYPVGDSAGMLIKLTMIMLPYLPLICLAALLNAVLHAQHIFSWPAISPIVFNLVWLCSIVLVIVFVDIPYQQAFFIAGSLLIGGLFQLYIPWHKLRQQEFSQEGNSHHQGKIWSLFKSMLPVMLGLSITQINTMLDSMLAWVFANPEVFIGQGNQLWVVMDHGTAASLYLGQRMYQFPLGVFGVALGTVLFPAMAQHAKNKDYASFKRDLLLGLKLVAIIGIPASAGLMALATPVTYLLFQHGQFNAEDTALTSKMVFAYATGIWAYISLLIIHRGFYALDDRMTPLTIGIWAVLVNLVLSLILVFQLGAMGLALGTSLTAMLQSQLSLKMLVRRIGTLDLTPLVKTLFKVICMTLAMYSVIYISSEATMHAGLLPDGSNGQRLLQLIIPGAMGVGVYSLLCWLCDVPEYFELLSLKNNSS